MVKLAPLILLGVLGCVPPAFARLANIPIALEDAALISYETSLAACKPSDIENPESRRDRIKDAWKPLIELFERAHLDYCEILGIQAEGCAP